MKNKNLEIYYQFFDIFRNENDRGAVLSAAAFLDVSLDNILKSFLADVNSTKELLNGFSAPLGTLGAKTKLAYSLGLIDEEIFNFIEIIRKIRNEFAHSWKDISFNSEKIKLLIAKCPNHDLIGKLPQNFHEKKRDRKWFNSNVSFYLLELSILPEVIRINKRKPNRLLSFGEIHSSKEAAEKAANNEYDCD